MSVILGIETSCDETAASIVVNGEDIRSNVVASQIAKHSPYGGVVPELAAREHLEAINHVVSQALHDADMKIDEVDAVAVTNGPGLMPALLVGVSFARGLALSNDIPLIGTNHFLAHIYGAFLDCGVKELEHEDIYPMISLVVSGGHTNLVKITADGKAEVVGTTIDDAAGEAFDKGAKLLNLGYPGGPILERIARNGDKKAYAFPRSLTGAGGKKVTEGNRFNFSFSGLKTALLYHCDKLGGGDKVEGKVLEDSIASYQEAIVDVLVRKTKDAVEFFGGKSIVVSGGVACNGPLRERFEMVFSKDYNLFLAPKKYCTDNAAMVAGIGFHYYQKELFSPLDIDAYARLPKISNVPFCQSSTAGQE